MNFDNQLRVVVCGGRDYYDATKFWKVLDSVRDIAGSEQLMLVVCSGGCSGADELADDWCTLRGIPFFECPANWSYYGKGAGFERNTWMLDFFAPHLVVAFPGGNGTADTVTKAKERGIKVNEIEE